MADPKRHLDWQQAFGLSTVTLNLKEELIGQLEKDLNLQFSDDQPDTLYRQTYETVSYRVQQNSLSELLYRIDVNEGKAAACLAEEDPVHCLTRMILKREAQKVLFRRQYSG